MGQQRHPAVPRISGCRAVPPSLPHPPTPHTHTHTQAHTSFEHPYPTPAHTQTNIIPCQNTNTVTPTKQQYGNMHMSKDCLSGNTAHSNKCASLESFMRWENVGRKLEKATQIITTTHKHTSAASLRPCADTKLRLRSLIL